MNLTTAIATPLLVLALGPHLMAQFVHQVQDLTSPAPPPLISVVQNNNAEVLGTGQNGSTFRWSAATSTWSNTGAPLQPALNIAMMVTRTGGVAFGLNGNTNTLQWTGTQWSSGTTSGTPPTAFGNFGLAALPGSEVLLFGGLNASSIPVGETWLLSANNVWSQVQPSLAPSPREFPVMAAFPNGTVVLFGGRNGTTVFADTWIFSGGSSGNWTRVSLSGPPPGRCLAGLAFRPSTNNLTMVGGVDATGASIGDAWLCNAAGTWTQINPASYSLALGHTIVLGAAVDPTSDEVVAYGIGTQSTILGGVSGMNKFGAGCTCSSIADIEFVLVIGPGGARWGQTFTIAFSNYGVGNALFLASDPAPLVPPTQFPGLPLGCNQLIAGPAGSVLVSAAAPVAPIPTWTSPTIPSNPSLIGSHIFFQGVQLPFPTFIGCSSDAIDVLIGR